MILAGPRILFVRNSRASFIEADVAILRDCYPLTDCHLRSRWINPLALWRQVRHHDLVVCWFASWHSFLPLLFARISRRPSLLIIGGYDVANMPEIGYGHQRGGLKKWISGWNVRMATRLMTNARYSRQEAARNTGVAKDRILVVYHGVEGVHDNLPAEPREKMALTVGNVDRPNLWRKGLEPFVRAAALLPDVRFVLVGEGLDDAMDRLRTIATPNVHFTGRVDNQTLQEYYRRAAVYVQASAHEGFGLSLAEAMLAGCVPVVTRCGALPEVAGETGIYAASQDPGDVAGAIRQALQSESAGVAARQRILNRFPMSARRRALQQLVEDLCPGSDISASTPVAQVASSGD